MACCRPRRSAPAWSALLSLAAAAAAPAQTPRGHVPPCAACVVAEVPVDALADLAAAHASVPLAGAQVLAAVDDWGAVPADAVHRLAGRGVLITLEGTRLDSTPGADVLGDLTALVWDLRRTPASASAAALAFDIKQRATAAKAINPDLRTGVEASVPAIDALIDQGIGSYVDFVVTAGSPGGTKSEVALWERDGTRSGLDALAPPADARAERVVRPLTSAYVATLAALGALLPRDLLPSGTPLVQCEPACASEGFSNPATLDVVAVVDLSRRPRRIRGDPDSPDARALIVDDRGALVARPLAALTPDAIPASRVLVHIPGSAAAGRGRFAGGVQVVGRRRLTVEAIVARHQQARARERRVLRTLISSGRSVLTFEAPGFAAPVTISADTTTFAAAELLEVEQREVRVNGLALGGASRVPRLPLIDAERLATPPLALTLTDAYRYRLDGEETRAGERCHVVAFAASNGDVAGRAWIAVGDFGLVRLAVTPRASRGPSVSSEQRDEFTRIVEQGVAVWLPRRTEIDQVYEGVAHRTAIHRVIDIAAHAVNPVDFDDRLRAARAGPGIVLRRTPDGFRYLERTSAPAEPPIEIPARDSQRVRTVAFGVIVDPNITRPLPFAGLSYLDFNLLGTGTQLDVFAGAGYGRAAFATSALGRTRWRLMGDASGIAARYNDRVFEAGRERYDLNLRQRPVQARAGIVGPVGRTVRIRGEYHVDYTRLGRGDATAPGFIVPPSPIVHAARVSIDGQRGPWSGGAWWSPATRQRWTAWGIPGAGAGPAEAARARAFQQYGASLARAFVFSARTVARVDVAWMDGRDLDRFSRFTFGAVENRLRGYPAASIRYDRGVVAHSVVSWTAGPRLRLDGFFDLACVREPATRRAARTYPGVGAAVEVPMPLGLLAALEWGYGIRRLGDSGAGTQVARVTAYKMF